MWLTFNNNNGFNNPLTVKLSKYPKTILSYLLGFPIHIRFPTNSELIDLLNKFDKLSCSDYYKEISNIPINKSIILSDTFKTINEENVYGDDINNYLPFDKYEILVNVSDCPKSYTFTREEFPTLLDKKQNYWTKTDLSLTDLSLIESRHNISVKLNLPSPSTFQQLIDRVQKDQLYLDEDTKNTTSNTNNTSTSNITSFTLPQNFSSLLNDNEVNTQLFNLLQYMFRQ